MILIVIVVLQVRAVSIAAREVLSSVPDSDLSSLKNGFRVASECNGRPTATVSYNAFKSFFLFFQWESK